MKKYVLFGAGFFGRQAIKLINRREIAYFVDNDPVKAGTELEQIKILYFEDIKNELSSYNVMLTVSPDKQKLIIEQLLKIGIDKYETFEEMKERVINERITKSHDNINIYKNGIKWIKCHDGDDGGIAHSSNNSKSYPEVSGYYIPTLLRWGYRKEAKDYAEYLCKIQKEDGSWHDTDDKRPYVFDTGQVIKGLIAVRDIYPLVDDHIKKGCEWLLSMIYEDGRLAAYSEDVWKKGYVSELVHIYCLSPLRDAGIVFDEEKYATAAKKSLRYYVNNYREDILSFNLLSHFQAYVIEGLFDMGEKELASIAMEHMAEYQKESGAVPAYNNVEWVCSTGLFQLALIWFKMGNIERGNRAFSFACRLQNEGGGWFGSYLSEDAPNEINTYFPDNEISWAEKYFLDALYYKNIAEFNAFFEAGELKCFNNIDQSDELYQTVLHYAKEITSDAKGGNVLDVGCGWGRYIRNLLEDLPECKYHAVDLSDAPMQFMDSSKVDKKIGVLTDIPYEDGSMDFTYTCEALEHAVEIENSIKEMVRVTRTGGMILIIDKNLKSLKKFKIMEWEQYFDEEKLKKMMKKYCYDVDVISGLKSGGKGAIPLFSAWVGRV